MSELLPEFKKFSKIPRLYQEITITEKIDGSNGLIYVQDDFVKSANMDLYHKETIVQAGSRNQWITPQKDSHGFAAWVEEHKDRLSWLGNGYHYGEWYGHKINRNYGLAEKRFALFNHDRDYKNLLPVTYVPILYKGPYTDTVIERILSQLRLKGSTLVPGFMKPEGIVVTFTHGGRFKVFC